MYQLPTHLHQPHKIGPLDTEDMALAVLFYLFANTISFYSLFITIPLLVLIVKTKQSRNRGFIKHWLFSSDLFKAENYPPIYQQVFYE